MKVWDVRSSMGKLMSLVACTSMLDISQKGKGGGTLCLAQYQCNFVNKSLPEKEHLLYSLPE